MLCVTVVVIINVSGNAPYARVQSDFVQTDVCVCVDVSGDIQSDFVSMR